MGINGRLLGRLRAVALVAAMLGAVGSVALTLRAGRSTPRLLLAVFVLWVLAPFVALAWATVVSPRWAGVTRATLYCLTLVLTLGSLAIYGELVKRPAGSANAFMFVVTPPVAWVLIAIAVPLAALVSRRQSSRRAAP
jgi:hypothetical protein